MHKVLQAPTRSRRTPGRASATGTVSDFRAHNRYRMGSFGALDALNENGEFKNKAISDAEKATITAATKGNIINVSRQMIVNDDMGAFFALPAMLGRAAALSVEVDVYALLAQNAGLGPTLSDGASRCSTRRTATSDRRRARRGARRSTASRWRARRIRTATTSSTSSRRCCCCRSVSAARRASSTSRSTTRTRSRTSRR
jgi:hypothetical protein